MLSPVQANGAVSLGPSLCGHERHPPPGESLPSLVVRRLTKPINDGDQPSFALVLRVQFVRVALKLTGAEWGARLVLRPQPSHCVALCVQRDDLKIDTF